MKSYAVGESETDQGYAKYHIDSDDLRVVYYLLLLIVTNVSLFLSARLCHKATGDLIDGMMQMVIESIVAISPKPWPSLPQMSINDVESNNTADDDATESDNTATNAASSEDSDKYLTIVSRMEYIAMYALIVIVFTICDTILYNHLTSIQAANKHYFLIPWQIVVSTLYSIICIIMYGALYMIYKKCNHKEIKQHCLKHWEEWAAIPFITVLTNYVVVHVFWILLLLISFPVLVALRGIFLIPLSLPVILVLQRIFSCCKIRCRCRCNQIALKNFVTLPRCMYYCVPFYFFLFWIPLLMLFYLVSNYSLNASEISNDPLKLIIILLGAIFITYRVAKVWGREFFFERRQRRHVNTRESETNLISTNNNNYNTV